MSFRRTCVIAIAAVGLLAAAFHAGQSYPSQTDSAFGIPQANFFKPVPGTSPFLSDTGTGVIQNPLGPAVPPEYAPEPVPAPMGVTPLPSLPDPNVMQIPVPPQGLFLYVPPINSTLPSFAPGGYSNPPGSLPYDPDMATRRHYRL